MSYKTHNPVRRGHEDPLAAAGVLAARRRRCADADHPDDDIVTVAAGQVAYAPGGRRRADGERYCRACGAALEPPVSD